MHKINNIFKNQVLFLIVEHRGKIQREKREKIDNMQQEPEKCVTSDIQFY